MAKTNSFNTYGRDPFDCLRDSRAHLVELGYESWF